MPAHLPGLTPCSALRLKQLKGFKRALHLDKAVRLPPRQRHLAKLTAALEHLCSALSVSRGVDGATESVAPDPNDYPEYFLDSFANTVGVDLVDLTPPDELWDWWYRQRCK